MTRRNNIVATVGDMEHITERDVAFAKRFIRHAGMVSREQLTIVEKVLSCGTIKLYEPDKHEHVPKGRRL